MLHRCKMHFAIAIAKHHVINVTVRIIIRQDSLVRQRGQSSIIVEHRDIRKFLRIVRLIAGLF